MVYIVQRDDGILREKAKEVPKAEIKSAEIAKIISDMKSALASQLDGVAIAAPQIGVPLRIFVVSGKIFRKKAKKNIGEEAITPPTKTENGKKNVAEIPTPPDLVFINPEIKKLSKDVAAVEEGCLSVRWAYGKIRRAKKATVSAYDENGKHFTRGASGLLAQIFQHETDHLDGRLFTDKATEVREMPPTETV